MLLRRKPGSFVHCKYNVIITFITMHDVLQKYNAEATAYLGAKLYTPQVPSFYGALCRKGLAKNMRSLGLPTLKYNFQYYR